MAGHKRPIAHEVASHADELKRMGLDPAGQDGREISAALDWFAAALAAKGVCEHSVSKARSQFIPHAAWLMAYMMRRCAEPCEKAEVNHHENHS